jgi:hypothetical protein
MYEPGHCANLTLASRTVGRGEGGYQMTGFHSRLFVRPSLYGWFLIVGGHQGRVMRTSRPGSLSHVHRLGGRRDLPSLGSIGSAWLDLWGPASLGGFSQSRKRVPGAAPGCALWPRMLVCGKLAGCDGPGEEASLGARWASYRFVPLPIQSGVGAATRLIHCSPAVTDGVRPTVHPTDDGHASSSSVGWRRLPLQLLRQLGVRRPLLEACEGVSAPLASTRPTVPRRRAEEDADV